jgi:hypothetical protein
MSEVTVNERTVPEFWRLMIDDPWRNSETVMLWEESGKSWREIAEEYANQLYELEEGLPILQRVTNQTPPRPGAYWVKGHWRGGVTQKGLTTKSVQVLYHNETDKPVLVTGIDFSQNPPVVKTLDNPIHWGPRYERHVY